MFYLGDKSVEYDINLPESREELFQGIMALPQVIDSENEYEICENFPQENAVGVLQKGRMVIIGQSEFYIGGTDGVIPCCCLSLYDPDLQKLAILHKDTTPGVDDLQPVLEEFKTSRVVEVRFFGGVVPGFDYSIDESESLKMAKNIFWYLYQAITKDNLGFKIIFRTSDMFEKLTAYRNYREQQGVSATVGFAINSKTGSVLVFPTSKEAQAAGLPEFLPYSVQLDNCGFYSGFFKNTSVYIKMHMLLGYGTNELVKHYDGTITNWEQKYANKLRRKSIKGHVNQLVKWLKILDLLPTDDNCNSTLETKKFISDHILDWQQELHYEDDPARNLFLFSFCHYSAIFERFEDILERENIKLKDTFLVKLFMSERLQRWCIEKSYYWVAELIIELRDLMAKQDEICKDKEKEFTYEKESKITESNDVKVLIEKLLQIKGARTMLMQLVNYEAQSRKNEVANSNLIKMLLDSNDGDDEIINRWFITTIREHYATIVDDILSETNNEDNEALKDTLIDLFNSRIEVIKVPEFNLDSFCFDTENSLIFTNSIVSLLTRNRLFTFFTSCLPAAHLDIRITCENIDQLLQASCNDAEFKFDMPTVLGKVRIIKSIFHYDRLFLSSDSRNDDGEKEKEKDESVNYRFSK